MGGKVRGNIRGQGGFWLNGSNRILAQSRPSDPTGYHRWGVGQDTENPESSLN